MSRSCRDRSEANRIVANPLASLSGIALGKQSGLAGSNMSVFSALTLLLAPFRSVKGREKHSWQSSQNQHTHVLFVISRVRAMALTTSVAYRRTLGHYSSEDLLCAK